MLQRTQQQEILHILEQLPQDKLREVIDFAEYLKAKATKTKKKARPVTVPTFHLGAVEKGALDRGALYGEHLACKFD